MRVLVTGGRDYADHAALWKVLDELKPTVIIHGDATGADAYAGEWAEIRGVLCVVEPAKWDLIGPFAGNLRNMVMIDRHHPDLVVACPGGNGTRHCVTYALLRGIPVRRVA